MYGGQKIRATQGPLLTIHSLSLVYHFLPSCMPMPILLSISTSFSPNPLPPSSTLRKSRGQQLFKKSKKKWIRICRLHLIERHLDSEAPGCCQSPHRLIPKVLTINWRNPGSVMSCTYKITRTLPNFVGTHKVASSIKVFLEYTTSVKCPILLHFLHSLSKDLHFS